MSRAQKFCTVAFMLAFTPVLLGEDFYIVLHPATGLAPDSAVMAERLLKEREPRLLHQYSESQPKRLAGTSVKDAPNTKSFIVVMEKPSGVAYEAVQLGRTHEGTQVRVPYTGVVAVEPFSIWQRADAGKAPVLLGRGFYWGRATQIKITKPGSTDFEFVKIDRSVDEMIHMAVADQFNTYPSLLADCWSPSVVAQPPTLNVTAQRILEWGKMPTQPPSAMNLSPLEQRNVRDKYFTPAAMLVVRTTYKPSRITRNADRSPVVELDLNNRLPVAAHGSLECRQEYTATHRDNHTPAPPRVLKQSIQYRFRLQPGEKDVARFVLPAGTDSQTLGDLVIAIDPKNSYLGDHLKKSESKARKKGK